MEGAIAVFFELCASLGAGVVVGLIGALAMGYFSIGFLRDYTVLLGSLTAYGVSATICVAMSLRSQERFNFDLIAERVVSFHIEPTTASVQSPIHTPTSHGVRVVTNPA